MGNVKHILTGVDVPDKEKPNDALMKGWVGLTDEEIKDIVGRNDPGGIGEYTREIFKKIEDKLKGKNT